MSTHGACFDSGMSGNCGWECIPFLEGECSIADEFADSGEYLDEEKLLTLYEVYDIVPSIIVQPQDPFDDKSDEINFFSDEFSIDTS